MAARHDTPCLACQSTPGFMQRRRLKGFEKHAHTNAMLNCKSHVQVYESYVTRSVTFLHQRLATKPLIHHKTLTADDQNFLHALQQGGKVLLTK